MRKLVKFPLGKVNIAQEDILQKKQMRNIMGGYLCQIASAYGCNMTVEANSMEDIYDILAELCPGGYMISCNF